MPAERRLTPALRGRRTRAADKLRLRCWVLVLVCCLFGGVCCVVACFRLWLRFGVFVVFVLAVSVASSCCCAVPVAAVGGAVPLACSWCSAFLASVASSRFCRLGSVGLRLSFVPVFAFVAVLLPVVFAGVRLGGCSRWWAAAASVLLSVAFAVWRPRLIVACLLGAGFLPVPFFYVTTCAATNLRGRNFFCYRDNCAGDTLNAASRAAAGGDPAHPFRAAATARGGSTAAVIATSTLNPTCHHHPPPAGGAAGLPALSAGYACRPSVGGFACRKNSGALTRRAPSAFGGAPRRRPSPQKKGGGHPPAAFGGSPPKKTGVERFNRNRTRQRRNLQRQTFQRQ